MAVDDLLSGRIQLVNKPGTGMIAQQAVLPRLSKSPLWDKRQRSPVRSAAVSPVRPLRPKEEVEAMKAQRSEEFNLGGQQHSMLTSRSLLSAASNGELSEHTLRSVTPSFINGEPSVWSLYSAMPTLDTERARTVSRARPFSSSEGRTRWTPRTGRHSPARASGGYILRYSAPEGYAESAIAAYERQSGKRLTSTRRPATAAALQQGVHWEYKPIPQTENNTEPLRPTPTQPLRWSRQASETKRLYKWRPVTAATIPHSSMSHPQPNDPNSFLNTMVVRPTSAAVAYQQTAAGAASLLRHKQQQLLS